MSQRPRYGMLAGDCFHGCARKENKTREYNAWQHAKHRCLNKNCPKFKYYGGRGITMCDEWVHSFEAFFAHIGKCPKGYWLDRIDNDRGYEPGNVRWATPTAQQRNKRNTRFYDYHGRRVTFPELCEMHGMKTHAVYQRVHAGWDMLTALMVPMKYSYE